MKGKKPGAVIAVPIAVLAVILFLRNWPSQLDPNFLTYGQTGSSGSSSIPDIASISPASGNVGTTLRATLTGSNLSGATVVQFSGTGATAAIVTGGASTSLPINVTLAADAALGARSVTVSTNAGTSSSFSGFLVTSPEAGPTLTLINPDRTGVGSADLTITLSGSGFAANSVVRLNSVDLATTFVSATQLRAVITASNFTATKTLGLTVFNPGSGTSGFLQFLVLALIPPTISSISPSSGAAETSLVATIAGTNLLGADSVTFLGTGVTAAVLTGGTATRLSINISIASDATSVAQSFRVHTPAGSSSTSCCFTATGNSRLWTATAAPLVARVGHTATLLLDGRVLVAGGSTSNNHTASAEVYDPATGVWTTTGFMSSARAFHTATLLPDGKVLVAGGRPNSSIDTPTLNSAEVYEPATGVWSPAGSMKVARSYHAATILLDGTVLVAGGLNNQGHIAAAESFDARTNAWSSAGSLTVPRQRPSLLLLPSGRVLAVGGSGGATTNLASLNVINTTDLYNPDAKTWSSAIPPSLSRMKAVLSLLPDGRGLVAGGTPFLLTETYDSAAGNWTISGDLNTRHDVAGSGPLGALLPNNRVLILSGCCEGFIAELFDPSFSTWSLTDSMINNRLEGTATLLQNGKLLVTSSNVPMSYAEVYDSGGAGPGTSILSSISPSSGTTGSPLVSIMLAGSNFVSNSIAKLDGQNLTTIYLGSTKLVAFVPSARLQSAGTPSITVSNPSAGGGTSQAKVFTISTAALPTITSISPALGAPGSTVNATITGTNLSNLVSVQFSGSGVTATISGGASTSLPIQIAIASNAALGPRAITVITSAGSSTAFLSFVVGNVATISSVNATPAGLSQTVAPLNGQPFTLTLNGQAFVTESQVVMGTAVLPTTFSSASQLMASVPASLLKIPETFPVKVSNPGPLDSNTIDFRVVERADVNGSRSVSIGDALVTALNAGGINRPPLPVATGDINFSGSSNIGDALVIALFSGRINPNLPTPAITAVSPAVAQRGSTLTISGTGFSASSPDQNVSFTIGGGGVGRLIPASSTPSSLSVTVPADAVSGFVQVIRQDASIASAAFPLEVSSTAVPLMLAGITPFYKVSAGSTISLTGSGFDTTAANNTVTFRGSSGPVTGVVTSATANALNMLVPSDAQCGNVTVRVGSQTSNARALVVSGSACPLGLADIIGGGGPGDLIVIEGTGFNSVVPGNNVVAFAASSGTASGTVVAAGQTQLQVLVPDGAVQGNITVIVGEETSNALTFRPVSATTPASVSVVVTSPAAVGAYQVTLNFNKDLVRLDSTGVSGGSGAGFTGPPTTINIDNGAGRVTLNAFQTGSSPTGTFAVANLVFTPGRLARAISR